MPLLQARDGGVGGWVDGDRQGRGQNSVLPGGHHEGRRGPHQNTLDEDKNFRLKDKPFFLYKRTQKQLFNEPREVIDQMSWTY